MHELTGDQDAVLEVMRHTIFHLGLDAPRTRAANIRAANKSAAGTRALSTPRAGQHEAERDEIVDRLQRAFEREEDRTKLARSVEATAATTATRSRSGARRSAAPPAMPSESATKDWYMPRDRTVAVFQAAMDEYLSEVADGAAKKRTASKSRARAAGDDKSNAANASAGINAFFVNRQQGASKAKSQHGEIRTRASFEQYDTLDPRWASVVWEKAKMLLKGKAKFITHKDKTDFRFSLAARSTVALVSDWGGGNAAARDVAKEIKRRAPDHVIHLGDVYYAGTEREIQQRFLDLWDFWGTPAVAGRSFALNSNHEMYGGGHAYFKTTLKALKQPSSYFVLGNNHWRLIGLDTGYVDHDLNREQLEWLSGQLTGSAKNVLMSHHQPYSAFTNGNPGEKLLSRVRAHTDRNKIYGWFWGHEHLCVKYENHLGIKGRCIGHGCIPYDIPDIPRSPAVGVAWMNRRELQADDNRGMHGFALLTFNGARLQIEYVDRDGTVSHTEEF